MSDYEINVETLLIVPFEKGKSKVYEVDGEYVVNMTPLMIIKKSCLYFGCSFDGRKDAVKEIIGADMKIPILIEDSKNIIFFPTSSCINQDSIWISYQNLLKYSKIDMFSTMLYFRNNRNIKVNIKYNLINNQVIRCIKLESMLLKRKKFLENECIIIDDFMS